MDIELRGITKEFAKQIVVSTLKKWEEDTKNGLSEKSLEDTLAAEIVDAAHHNLYDEVDKLFKLIDWEADNEGLTLDELRSNFLSLDVI